MQSGFQLALELSNVFPVREAVKAMGDYILKLARDLRKSGSDLVVEEDLAEVFGRGKLSSGLETKFKDSTKITTITPLTPDSEVVLASGPGPTLQNAFRDRIYFSSVVQLSFLAWVQSRESLATMLSTSLNKRFRLGVHGASPDPGYEGITKTLVACSSQTSSFNWSEYVQMVQDRLQAAMPNYAYSPDYLRLTPSLLLGSMDYLYLVQSLPDDRRITVSNQKGAITLIIWAHYILGLAVAVVVSSGNSIIFGTIQDPHVTIFWSEDTSETENDLFWPEEHDDDEDPSIRLLDQNMSVILESAPEADRKGFLCETQERHPVADYGMAYLHRLFNRSKITDDNNPMYTESINLIISIAIVANGRVDRDPGQETSERRTQRLPVPPQTFSVEVWRILAAGKLLFASGSIDFATIEKSVEFFSKHPLDEKSCPNTFRAFLNELEIGRSAFSMALERLYDQIKYLVEVVLIFAHVANVETCTTMPIILDYNYPLIPNVLSVVCHDPDQRVNVKSYTLFHAIAKLLTETELDAPDDTPNLSSRAGYFLFLFSDFGWSVFLDSVGDRDPERCRPELIHVQQGTPMNSTTGERKHRIRDGVGYFTLAHPDAYPLARGTEFLPRLSAKVVKRKEYWTSRAQEFELTLHFSVTPSHEWRQQMTEDSPNIDQITGYRAMHDTLWRTFISQPCGHPIEATVEKLIPLGPDAVALLGWRREFEIYRVGSCPERILILLTRSDSRLRWLAVVEPFGGYSQRDHNESSHREFMLRASKCCDSCALAHAAGMPCRWALIL